MPNPCRETLTTEDVRDTDPGKTPGQRIRKVLFVMACPPGIAAQSGDLAVPPAGMLAIAGYCRQFYPDVAFMLRDFGAEKIPLAEQIEAVRQANPDIVGMAARSFIYPATVRLAEAIKKTYPNIKIVLGGQHPTLLPPDEKYPSCFDCVVRREGETGFLKLLDLYERNEAWPKLMTAEYLDDLNHDYAWDIIDNKESYVRPFSPFYPDAMGSVVWSRGCPFDCFFCSGPALWTASKPRVRYRSVDSICNELEYLTEKLNIRRIFVHDDTLNANLNKLSGICNAIIDRNIKITWAATGMRADESMTPEWIFPLLRKAGCRMISFGIESGDETVLRKINRKVTLAETERALQLCKKYGIKTGAGFTIGHIWLNDDGALDGETEEQLNKTYDYIKYLVSKQLLWSVVIAVIDPVPGSKLWDVAIRERLLYHEDLEHLLSYDRVRLNFKHPHLTPEVVEEYYLKAYRAFVMNPRQILYVLSSVRSFPDLAGILRVGLFVLKNRTFSFLKANHLRKLSKQTGNIAVVKEPGR